MLMKNINLSRKRPETSKESVLRLSPEGSNSVDIRRPLTPPLTAYDEAPLHTSKDMNVITIGQGVIFYGKVIKAESVVLEGTADGEILAGTVDISAAGSLDGNVKCDTLIVAGAFSGEATVVGGLSVKRTGRIEGKISYGSLSVEDGGAVLGTLEQSETKNLPATPLEGLVSKTPNPE
jgi:cytoskeletal protein CcmA (bactofilin family)